MLELSTIRDQFQDAVGGLLKRGISNAEEILNDLLELDNQRRETQAEMDQVLAESNSKAKQIGQMMQSGQHEQAESVKKETASLKGQAKQLQQKLQELMNHQQQALYNIPNIPHAQVPEGSAAEDNQIMEEWGEFPKLHEKAKPHWDLIKEYDIIDFELGNKISGAGFPFYKGKGAKLVRALTSFCLDQAEAAGYYEIQPPLIVNEASGLATGQLPDKEGQMYAITDSDHYLIPTAEVPITNIYRDALLEQKDLPIRNVGFTQCFRREAGSWGSDVRGLNRLHQFDKVEIVQVTHPDQSYTTLAEMCDHVSQLLQKLEVPYRVLNLCGGDLGFTAAQTFDFEVYAAGQQKWLEVSSVSNFETYQANRLKLRCRGEGKKNFLLHTLNGSALAIPRLLAAILENNQSESGISIPKALIPYTRFEMIHF
jgi:seryl-tRNA synthetase